MYLYYFNSVNTEPLKIMIVRVINDDEYNQIIDSMSDIFQILIDDNLIVKDHILVFSLIKEYKQSIENITLPFTDKNIKYLDNCNINEKIINLLTFENCSYFYEIVNDEIHKNEVDYNMGFLIEKYC